jgi:hypothetical protein
MSFDISMLLNPAGAVAGALDKATGGMGDLGTILNPMGVVDSKLRSGITNALGPDHSELAGALLGATPKPPGPPAVGSTPSAPGPIFSPMTGAYSGGLFSAAKPPAIPAPMGLGAPPPGTV